MAGSLITFNKLSAGNRSSPTEISELTFSLPFPKEVIIDTEYAWEPTEFGVKEFLAFGAAQAVGADTAGQAGSAFSNGILSQLPEVAGRAAARGLAAVGRNGIAGISNNLPIVNAALAGAGKLVNPKLEVLFKGVQHRTFDLVFDIAPTTATDSVNLFKFLKKLHEFAAPDLIAGGAFFDFPKTTKVVIRGDGSGGGEVTIDRGNCAITRINVNMTPDGVWASFRNGKPVHVLIAIGFLELDLPTKENDSDLFG